MRARKRGATYPMTFQLLNNGAPVADIAGSTITITWVNRATGEVKVNGAAVTIVDAPTASLSYTPLAANVDTTGAYNLEVKQVRPDGTIRYFPNSGYEPLYIEDSLPVP